MWHNIDVYKRQGQLANEIRADIEGKIAEKSAEIKKNELEKRLLGEKIDVTMPGYLILASSIC